MEVNMISDSRILDTRGMSCIESLDQLERSISEFSGKDEEFMVIADTEEKKDSIKYFAEIVNGCKTVIEDAHQFYIVIIQRKPVECC